MADGGGMVAGKEDGTIAEMFADHLRISKIEPEAAEQREATAQAELAEVDKLRGQLQAAQQSDNAARAELAEVDKLRNQLQAAEQSDDAARTELAEVSKLHDQLQ